MAFGSPRPAGQRLREYAEDVIDDAASQVNYGPYVLPEVVASLAADDTPAQAAAQAVTDEIAGRSLVETTDPRMSKAVSLDDLAYARVFADGKRSFLEFDFDGKPTSWSSQLIEEAAADRHTTETATLAYARTFADGKRSFLEFLLDGSPTDWSAELIAEALQRIGAGLGAGVSLGEPDDWTEAEAARVTTAWTTYDGSGVVVHPSVRYFADGFNGYQWWAAATPFPGSNDALENPSIFVSTDGGDTWAPPPGVTNPLVPKPAGTGNYNADPHLVIGPDRTMHIFYRVYLQGAAGEGMYVISSTDGVTWGAPQLSRSLTGAMFAREVSPAIWYSAADDQWVMLNIRQGSIDAVERFTAPAITGPWSGPAQVTFDPALPVPAWHMDAWTYGKEVWALISTATEGATLNGGYSYLCKSTDGGQTFTASTKTFGGATTYRSAVVPMHTPSGVELDLFIGQASPWGVVRTRALMG